MDKFANALIKEDESIKSFGIQQRFFIVIEIGFLCALFLHIGFYITFNLLDVRFLADFNLYYSIPTFVLTAILFRLKKQQVAVILGVVEVILHQATACLVLGWESGFQYYVVYLLFAAPFFSTYVKGIWQWLIAGVGLIFGILIYFHAPFYEVDPGYLHFMSIANIMSVLLLNLIILHNYFNRTNKFEADLGANNRQLTVQANEIQTQNEELHQQKEEIIAQREFIENKNKELEYTTKEIQDSVRAAEDIQTSILPQSEKLELIAKDYFVLYKPKNIVSGDFYWCRQVGERKFVVVADCTGHGVQGAFMTLIGTMLLNTIVGARRVFDPSDILNDLNMMLPRLIQKEEVVKNNSMDLAIVTWEEKEGATTMDVEFEGAKSDMMYLDPVTQELHELKGSRKGIGTMRRSRALFETKRFTVPVGIIFYMFTDGYKDQNNRFRKKIGTASFREHLIAASQLENFGDQKLLLDQNLIEYSGEEEQRDDVLVLGFRP